MRSLAEELLELRTSKGISLRELQAKTGISNAYLNQLENGKIQEPSPIYLEKLSNFYGVDYFRLMRLAGYPTGREDENGIGGRLPNVLERLTHDEKEEVLRFIEMFVLPRRKK